MIEINLIEKKKAFKAPVVLGIDLGQLPWKMFIFAYIVGILPQGFVQSQFDDETAVKREEVDALVRKKNQLQSEINKNKGIREQLDAFNRQIEKLKKRSGQVDEILKLKTNPRYLLEKIARSTPEELWFDSLKIDQDNNLEIKGGSQSFASIGEFIQVLNESVFFEGSLQLKTSNTEEVKDKGNTYRQESFLITGKIKVYDPFLNGN